MRTWITTGTHAPTSFPTARLSTASTKRSDICSIDHIFCHAAARNRASESSHRRSVSPGWHIALMADVFDLLADTTRSRILMPLRDHDAVCVSDLADWTAVNESAVSHALRLRRAHRVWTHDERDAGSTTRSPTNT